MNIEKRGSKYRIRFSVNGERKSITIDHKPTKKEAEVLISEYKIEVGTKSTSEGSFEELAKEYIESKRNVLSPNTIRGYYGILKRLSEAFLKLDINSIDNLTIQREVNRLSAVLTPKTVKNTYSFINSVVSMYRPGLALNIKLPQAKKNDLYCPTEEDIRKILELAKPTRYYVPLCLGILGMRRGEIAALELSDLNGNLLTINKSTYTDEYNAQGIKSCPKTYDSQRTVYLSDELVKRINEQGYIYKGAESRLWAALRDMQEILGIEHFRFHDLRVYFATYAHLHGMPDKVIQSTAGWKSDYTMKKIYRKDQEKINHEYQKAFLDGLI